MADSNLNTPVIVQATRLDTSILPRNIFSQSYLLPEKYKEQNYKKRLWTDR